MKETASTKTNEISRRDFLKISGAAVVVFALTKAKGGLINWKESISGATRGLWRYDIRDTDIDILYGRHDMEQHLPENYEMPRMLVLESSTVVPRDKQELQMGNQTLNEREVMKRAKEGTKFAFLYPKDRDETVQKDEEALPFMMQFAANMYIFQKVFSHFQEKQGTQKSETNSLKPLLEAAAYVYLNYPQLLNDLYLLCGNEENRQMYELGVKLQRNLWPVVRKHKLHAREIIASLKMDYLIDQKLVPEDNPQSKPRLLTTLGSLHSLNETMRIPREERLTWIRDNIKELSEYFDVRSLYQIGIGQDSHRNEHGTMVVTDIQQIAHPDLAKIVSDALGMGDS